MISRKPHRESHTHWHRAHRLRRRAFASFGQWQRQVLCERPTSARGGRHLYGHVYARPDRSRSQRRRHRGHFRCRVRYRRRGKRLSDNPLRNNDTRLTTSEARVLSGIKICFLPIQSLGTANDVYQLVGDDVLARFVV